MSDASLIKDIKACLTKADKATASAEEHYIEAGKHLIELRKGKIKAAWLALVKSQCGLSHARAYELMKLAGGERTLDQTRAASNARQAKKRNKNKGRPLRHGRNVAAGSNVISLLGLKAAHQYTEEEYRADYRQNLLSTSRHAEEQAGVFEGEYLDGLWGFNELSVAADRVVKSWQAAVTRLRRLADAEEKAKADTA